MSEADLSTSIRDQVRASYARLAEPARRLAFEPPVKPHDVSKMPVVVLLGNHSSGKSSFINYLLGDEVQRTGIAPNDDGFTVIVHGEVPSEMDGPTMVSDLDLGWHDLESFGPAFVNRLKLRAHASPRLRSLVLVDSPGMIDSVRQTVNRGYDFGAATRWFAQRADLVLFLFDPFDPGTTGETMQTLLGLQGYEHKLKLVFNQVDRFSSTWDYARTYGALCWNLGRLFETKDMPRVFSIFIPVAGEVSPEGHPLPIGNFLKERAELFKIIDETNHKHPDNLVSNLYRYARRLEMFATVRDWARAERRRHQRRHFVAGLVVAAVAGAGAYGAVQMPEMPVPGLVTSIVSVAVVVVLALYVLYAERKPEYSAEQMFEGAYSQSMGLEGKAAELRDYWSSIRPHVTDAIRQRRKAPAFDGASKSAIGEVLTDAVPKMRRQIRASHKLRVEPESS